MTDSEVARRLRRPTPLGYRLLIRIWNWTQWLRPRFYRYLWHKRVLRSESMTATVAGFPMILDLKSSGISSALAIRGIREPVHLRLLRESVGSGDVVVDLGANVGYYALEECRRVGPEGRVIAVEPDPRNLPTLRRNLQAFGFEERSEVHPLAITDAPGERLFRLGLQTNLSHLEGYGSEELAGTSHPVRVESLDSLLKTLGLETFDFLRMDIEGGEAEVLGGMHDAVRAARPGARILMEVHPQLYRDREQMKRSLAGVVDTGFEPVAVVSAGEPRPVQFRRLGYSPDWVGFEGGYFRGVYSDVKAEDLGTLIVDLPHSSRYLLLEKAG